MVDTGIHVTDKCVSTATEQCRRLIAGTFAVSNLSTVLDRIDQNLLLNLSDLAVDQSVRSLLCKGVQFSPISAEPIRQVRVCTRKCIDDFLFAVGNRLSYEQFVSSGQTRFFHKSDNVDAATGLRLQGWRYKFRKNVSKAKPGLDPDLSFDHLQLLDIWRTALYKTVDRSRIFRIANLSPDECKSLRSLRTAVKAGNLIIRKADKSRQIVIMNRDSYVKAVTDMLNSPGYTKVAFNGKFRCAALIIRAVKQYASALSTTEVHELLRFTKQPASRAFYALPKTHKGKEKWKYGLPPLRPICPDVKTETSMSAKFIAAFLARFVERIPTYVRNSYAVLSMLHNLRHLPPDAVWLAADVDQLYPSIPVTDAFDTIRNLVSSGSSLIDADSVIPRLVLDLLHTHLHYNFLEFDGQCWLQKIGIPMGKAWAPAVACLYMDLWDRELVQSLTVKPLFFIRYIDDLLFVFPDKAAAEVALVRMNELRSNIKITEFTIGPAVHFLDLNLELLPFRPPLCLNLPFEPDFDEIVIRVSLYRKPTDLIALLHFCSSQVWPVKVNTLYGQCLRILRLTNDPWTAGQNIYTLLSVMKRFRGLPSRTLRRIRCKIIWAFARSLLSCAQGSTMNEKTSPAIRRSLLALPMNIDHALFRKTLTSLLDMLSLRERRFVGHCSIISHRRPKLGCLLFK
jgi:hypothetical protein